MLDVYEFNQTQQLRDLFVYAYKKSAARYSQVSRTVGEPDSFYMQYRENIK